MPSKQRGSVAYTGVDSVRREDFFGLYRTFHSSCNKSPVQTDDYDTTEATSDREPVAYYVASEWIDYENSLFRRFNNCHHISRKSGMTGSGKISLENIAITSDTQPFTGDCTSNGYIYQTNTIRKYLQLDLSNSLLEELMPISIDNSDRYLPIGYESYDSKINELNQLALATMIPRLDRGFSLPRFVFEIFELKSLWLNVVALLRNIFGLFGSFLKQLRALIGRKPLNKLSSAYLATIFGALPLVSDIKAIIHRVLEMRTEVSNFIRNRGKCLTYHYEKHLSPYTFRPESWFTNESSIILDATHQSDAWWFARNQFYSIGLSTQVSREVIEPVFHATMDFSYDVKVIPDMLMAFFASLDVWGVNLSISDVWEVVPFSFVVDWIWDVGSVLRRYDLVNVPIHVVVYDYCYSVKYSMIETIRLPELISVQLTESGPVEGPDQWVLTPTNGQVFQSNISSYYRRHGIPRPSQEVLPNLTFPSGMKWVTASALLLQRRKR